MVARAREPGEGHALTGAVISVERAGKTYPSGTLAVAPVDLAVQRGEFVALLGPSGCGKTTLLRMIAGLVAPTEGRVVMEDQARVAMVFQSPTLMPWARVAGNVRLPLDLAHVPRATADAAVRDALALVGLADAGERYPRELSGGMQMRAAIARALAVSPSVLLMDEPFAALDEFTRHRLDDDLAALWAARGLTVVFVTHSIQEAVYLATRIVVMSARPGRIAADLAVDGPHPRGRDYRGSAAFASWCARVSDTIVPS
ncbi:MAG: ABC transporter ATP-binding protein [Burkholderiales bacterium]